MQRQKICINGLWDFCPGDGSLDSIPEIWESTKIVVPCPWNINALVPSKDFDFNGENIVLRGGDLNLYPEYPEEWEDAKSGWYKTNFFVMNDFNGSNLNLCFNAVHYYSEFYINGKLVCSDKDGFLPIEFAITDYVKYGQNNTLVVGVKKAELFITKTSEDHGKIDFPLGSFWGMAMAGIWQDVFLIIYPQEYIGDVFVHTNIKDNILTIEIEKNETQQLIFEILFILRECNGSKEFNLGSVVNEALEKYIFEYDYTQIKDQINLWWPNSPSLYFVDVILKLNGEVLDKKATRFGFRSFESIGSKFYLNGIPYNLRNDSWHYLGFACQTEEYVRQWYKMEKDANVNSIRLHAQVYPEFFIEIADEMGMLIVDETSVWASHCMFSYSMTFIENCMKHIERLVKRDRNHPSVVIWSVENECTMAYRVSGDKAVKNEEELNSRLFMLSEHAKKFDPTRITSADGSYDLNGRMEVISLHYPGKDAPARKDKPITIGEMGSLYYSTPDSVSTFYGEKVYISFDERLKAIGEEIYPLLKSQRKWAAQICVFNLVWYGLNPLPIKERILEYENYATTGIKPTKIGPYMSTLNANYDKELPDYDPNPIFKQVKEIYIPERFFFEDEHVRFFSGEKCIKSICVHNDSLLEKKYSILWSIEKEGVVYSNSYSMVTIMPSEFKLLHVELDLPQVESSENWNLKVKMVEDITNIFEENITLKIYNQRFLLSRISEEGKVAIAGISEITLREALSKFNITIIEDSSRLDEIDVILIGGEITSEFLHNIEKSTAAVINLVPDICGYKSFITHLNVEKAFINIQIDILRKEIEDEDICAWKNGVVADRVFQDSIIGNMDVLITNGKGFPLVLNYCNNNTNIMLCCINILDNLCNEPASLILLSNLIAYAKSKGKKSLLQKCTIISKENSELTAFLKELNVSYTIIDLEDKKAIKALRNVSVIIADGNYKLDYLNHIMPKNTAEILIWNLKTINIPLSLKGYLEIIDKPMYQLIKEDASHSSINGIHLDYLYGLEAGHEIIISNNLIYIKDGDKIKGILRSPDLDWRTWNFQGEDRKIVTIKRSSMEHKKKLYGLVETKINTVSTLIFQLNYNSKAKKIKKLASILLNNLGIKIRYKEEDEFDEIIKGGIYINKVVKILSLYSSERIDPIVIDPGINKPLKNSYWKILNIAEEENLKKGNYLYALYVYSESDRTNLLLNPDLMGVKIQSESHKELYINDIPVAVGKNILMNAIQLKAGWNKLIILEEKLHSDERSISVEFTEKNKDELELKFSLEKYGAAEISADKFELESNYNSKDCNNVTKGKGYYWSSIETQCKGMYFKTDLGNEYDLNKIQFSSKLQTDHVDIFTPRGLVIQGSLNNVEWFEIYKSVDESQLDFIDGKVILEFNKTKVRYVKILLDNVALKPLVISELKFSHII